MVDKDIDLSKYPKKGRGKGKKSRKNTNHESDESKHISDDNELINSSPADDLFDENGEIKDKKTNGPNYNESTQDRIASRLSLSFGDNDLNDDPRLISPGDDKSKCYPHSLLIGYDNRDVLAGGQKWVIRYGACRNGYFVLDKYYFFLPIDGESAESVIYRCMSVGKIDGHKGGVYLNTSEPTSIYLPAQIGFDIKKIKYKTGYPSTKLLTVLDILGNESMLVDIVYGDKLTYGKLLRMLTRYAVDHTDELNKYGMISIDYNSAVDTLIEKIECIMFDYNINFDKKSFVHFNICKHDVRNKQSERINDGLQVFKDKRKVNYLSTLCIIKALSLFISIDKKDPLVSDDDRERYQTIIGKYYDSVVLVAKTIGIDLDDIDGNLEGDQPHE